MNPFIESINGTTDNTTLGHGTNKAAKDEVKPLVEKMIELGQSIEAKKIVTSGDKTKIRELIDGIDIAMKKGKKTRDTLKPVAVAVSTDINSDTLKTFN